MHSLLLRVPGAPPLHSVQRPERLRRPAHQAYLLRLDPFPNRIRNSRNAHKKNAPGKAHHKRLPGAQNFKIQKSCLFFKDKLDSAVLPAVLCIGAWSNCFKSSLTLRAQASCRNLAFRDKPGLYIFSTFNRKRNKCASP